MVFGRTCAFAAPWGTLWLKYIFCIFFGPKSDCSSGVCSEHAGGAPWDALFLRYKFYIFFGLPESKMLEEKKYASYELTKQGLRILIS